MEPSVKDKHIIWGFVGFAILLISSIATLVVADKFNQDNFCASDSLCMQQPPWLAALSLFPDSHLRHIRNLPNQVRQEKTPAEVTEIREDQPQDAHKPVPPASMSTGGKQPRI